MQPSTDPILDHFLSHVSGFDMMVCPRPYLLDAASDRQARPNLGAKMQGMERTTHSRRCGTKRWAG